MKLRYVSTELHQIRDSPRRNLMESDAIKLHTLGDFPRDACRFHASFYEQCLPPFALMLLRPSNFVPDPTSVFGLHYDVRRQNLNETICLLQMLFDLLRGRMWLGEVFEPYNLKAHGP